MNLTQMSLSFLSIAFFLLSVHAVRLTRQKKDLTRQLEETRKELSKKYIELSNLDKSARWLSTELQKFGTIIMYRDDPPKFCFIRDKKKKEKDVEETHDNKPFDNPFDDILL